MKKSNPQKLTRKTKILASKFIAEEVRTGRYPREQAVAVGISRARAAATLPKEKGLTHG